MEYHLIRFDALILLRLFGLLRCVKYSADAEGAGGAFCAFQATEASGVVGIHIRRAAVYAEGVAAFAFGALVILQSH